MFAKRGSVVRAAKDGADNGPVVVDFSLLPNEVAEYVLRLMDLADLYTASLVCRQWAALISALPAWKHAKEEWKKYGRVMTSKRMATEQAEYKVAMIGPGGVGRNSFVRVFITSVFPTTYDPVIEDSYIAQRVVDDVEARFDVSITAGQEEFIALVQQVVREYGGYLIMYSVTNRVSFEEVERYLEMVYKVKDADQFTAPPIIILGNKLDLHSEREVSPAQGKALADKWTAYSWGLGHQEEGDGDEAKKKERLKEKGKRTLMPTEADYFVPGAPCFRFARNFFECSVKDNRVVEYHPHALARGAAWPTSSSPTSDWVEHECGTEVVMAEMVRQLDMWNHAVRDGRLFSTTTPGAKARRKRSRRKGLDKNCGLM